MTFLFLNILVGAVVSFAGSMPVGILNITAMRIGWSRGMRAVLYFALACALIEAVYSTIAVVAAKAFIQTDGQRAAAQLVSAIVLLMGGIYYWYKRPATETRPSANNLFTQGILLSVINVVAIPFWVVYTSLLQTNHWISIESRPSMTFYIAGISLGTGLALLTFGLLGKHAGSRFNLNIRLIDKGMGIILFSSGVVQALWMA